jgi:AcrR family transcriptional regulator
MTLELRHTPQQARSESTLAALTAAARVAASTYGYDRFTTADVASISGRSIGTVYRYFPDRLALLDAIDTGRTVAADVRAERARQDTKWGQQNHLDGTGPESEPLAGLGQYVTDWTATDWTTAARDSTDARAKLGTVTWTDILLEEVFEALAESDPAKLRAELVQVAAVAQQWAEAIDRRDS